LDNPEEAGLADVLILPGSKQTIDDLLWVRGRGFPQFLKTYPGMLIGICGGFQMLGISIEDPAGVESGGVPRSLQGLGELPVHTIMRGAKTVRRATGRTRAPDGASFSGYEIHMGETVYENGAQPFAEILREGEQYPTVDGAIASSGRVCGTYIHGLFDDDVFRHRFLHIARQASGLAPARRCVCVTAERQARIDRWANHLRESLDMHLIREWVGH
jgi:adenosylcobyric acid synthase